MPSAQLQPLQAACVCKALQVLQCSKPDAHCAQVAWAPGKRAVVVTAESDAAAPTSNGDMPHANGNGDICHN